MKERKINPGQCEKEIRRNNGGQDVRMQRANENGPTKDNYLKENSDIN